MDVRKGSPQCGPVSNKLRYDTISVSLLSVFFWWKNHPNMPTGSQKNLEPSKAVEFQLQNFFRFCDAGFVKNCGKEIGFRFRFMKKVRANSPRIRIGLSYGMTEFPPMCHEGNTTVVPGRRPDEPGQARWPGVNKFCDEGGHQNQRKNVSNPHVSSCFIKQEVCRNCSVVFWLYLSWNILNVKNICQWSATFYPWGFPDVFHIYSAFLKGHDFVWKILSRESVREKKVLVKWDIADTGQKIVHCKNISLEEKDSCEKKILV